jgi:hypothetical protein
MELSSARMCASSNPETSGRWWWCAGGCCACSHSIVARQRGKHHPAHALPRPPQALPCPASPSTLASPLCRMGPTTRAPAVL